MEIKCARKDKKEMRFEFAREADFLVFVTESQRSFKRQFDNEEHLCGICKRHLLGEKFFFLSGCEHYFCFECMQELVEFKIKNGEVSQITCAEDKCRKSLNDHDIKRMGLSDELVKKYEKFSLEHAISQMDDIGWCPMPGCKSLANLEKSENTGRC